MNDRPTLPVRPAFGPPEEELQGVSDKIAAIASALDKLRDTAIEVEKLFDFIGGKTGDEHVVAKAGDVTIPVPVSQIMTAKHSELIRVQNEVAAGVQALFDNLDRLRDATTPRQDPGLVAVQSALADWRQPDADQKG